MAEKDFSIEDFKKIKKYVLLKGKSEIWSNLYGKGHVYSFDNIKVIYTPEAKKGVTINAPWPEFLYIRVTGKDDSEKCIFVVQNSSTKLHYRVDYYKFNLHKIPLIRWFVHRYVIGILSHIKVSIEA